MERAQRFYELGADILFVEAPANEAEMRRIGEELPGYHMANMLEGGQTPDLPPAVLEEMGFALAAYPLTLMAAAMKAMLAALDALRDGRPRDELLLEFGELKQRIGFDEYYEVSGKYDTSQRD